MHGSTGLIITCSLVFGCSLEDESLTSDASNEGYGGQVTFDNLTLRR